MGRVDNVARTIGEFATAVRIGIQSSGLVDTNPAPAVWNHITKVDPEDSKTLPLLYPLYLRHTSAVSVGGSRDVTVRNTEETFELLQYADVPAFHEPSAPSHITERTWKRSRFTAIPEVLNGDSTSFVGALGAAAENIRDEIAPGLIDERAPWLPRRVHAFLSDALTSWLLEDAVYEAYIIQNLDSAAAREANVTEDDLVTPERAAHRALAAEKHLGSEVIYLEYSGRFGDEEAVEILDAVGDAVSRSRVWYGGGLNDRSKVRTVLEAGANTVIVGDAFHDVGAEEASLRSAAIDELDPDASRSTVRDWVDAAIDVEDSAAARYLDTIPSVAAPERTAREYLVTAGVTALELEGLAAAADDGSSTPAELRQFVREHLPTRSDGPSGLSGLDGDVDALLDEYAYHYVANRHDVDDADLPVGHVELDP